MRVVGRAVSNFILVPMDGSPLSERALEVALSENPNAEITVLHVIDPTESIARQNSIENRFTAPKSGTNGPRSSRRISSKTSES